MPEPTPLSEALKEWVQRNWPKPGEQVRHTYHTHGPELPPVDYRHHIHIDLDGNVHHGMTTRLDEMESTGVEGCMACVHLDGKVFCEGRPANMCEKNIHPEGD